MAVRKQKIEADTDRYIDRLTASITATMVNALRTSCQVDTGYLLSTIGVYERGLTQDGVYTIALDLAEYAAFVMPQGGGKRGQWLINARHAYVGKAPITNMRIDTSGYLAISFDISGLMPLAKVGRLATEEQPDMPKADAFDAVLNILSRRWTKKKKTEND